MHICRRCSGPTQDGFAFCQHCGAMLPTAPIGRSGAPTGGDFSPEAVAPTLAAGGEEAAMLRGGSPYGAPVPGAVTPVGGGGLAHAPTSSMPPVSITRPPGGRPGERPWGTLYSVRRDGSDGERFPLSSEWVEVGRQGMSMADFSFEDRYLAPRHARFEQQPTGCRVVPIDLLNGVFRRIRGAHVIPSGMHILIGRELFRFELCDEEEREVASLMRHGVAMFGSPPRKPWGRLMHVLASGSLRDVRHLHGAEVVLGREEGDIVFRDDEFLSRRHAVLRWQGGQCVLDDLNSSNGTFIRLRGPQPLEHGDTLRMGDQMFRIELGGA